MKSFVISSIFLLSMHTCWAKEIKDILLLNSYHTGYKWTNDLTDGVIDAIGNPDENRVFVEYMDYKRFQNRDFFYELTNLYKYKYGNIELDGIICADNFAFQFYLENGESIWNGNIPVTACGVNNIETFDFDTVKIKAIKEEIDVKNTIKYITQLQPNIDSLILISDQTLSGKIFLSQALDALKTHYPSLSYQIIDGSDYHELEEELKHVSPQGKAILLLSLYSNKHKVPIEMKALARELLAEVKIPAYSFWEFLLGDLIIGGSLIRGYDQGYEAGKQLSKRLSHPDAYVPAYTNSIYNQTFDYRMIEKYGIKIDQLSNNPQFINKEVPFWIKFKKQVIFLLSTFIVLIVINILLVTNVIQRKKAQLKLIESEKRLELALNSANEGLWDVLIKQGKVICNDNLAELLGYDSAEQININLKNWKSFVYDDDLPKINKAFLLHLKGTTSLFKSEIRLYKKNIELNYYAIYGKITERDTKNNPTRITGIVMDITAQKEFESELELAKIEAEKSNRTKTEFIANMSHEIRTPMNSIMGFTEVLENKNHDNRLNEYIQAIKSAGQTLLKLVNNILDLSKIEAGKLELNYTPVNLTALLIDTEQLFKTRAREKRIDFQVIFPQKLPMYVFMDELRVRQLLINLVGNAIKFTESGKVYVKLKILNQTDDELSLKFLVEDTGIGIKNKDLQKIFGAFEQQDNQDTRKYEGAGLGLTISNKLASIIESKIEVISTYGKGSTFSFVLDDVKVYNSKIKEDVNVTPIPENLKFQNSKILVVDNKSNTSAIIKAHLRDFDFDFFDADDENHAVELLNKITPDIVFINMGTSNVESPNAVRRIRKLPNFDKIPIISLTTLALQKKQNSSKKYSFSDFLIKPVNLSNLVRVLADHIPYQEYEPKGCVTSICLDELKDLSLIIPKKTIDEIVDLLESLEKRKSMNTYSQVAIKLCEIGKVHDSDIYNRLGNELFAKIKTYNITDIQKVIEIVKKVFIE